MRVHLAPFLLAAFPLFATAQEAEQWNFHAQSSYVWQNKPAFNARYDGPNSLTTAAEKSYSFTATAAFGLRLGADTELYFDPELSQGVALSGLVAGARWHRAGDTVGAAFVASGLSPGHRSFLERGGQTVFLGDGRLRYAPERVLEAYYSVALGKQTSLTADYQRISNPGFNADRGPASFYALRLHWEN